MFTGLQHHFITSGPGYANFYQQQFALQIPVYYFLSVSLSLSLSLSYQCITLSLSVSSNLNVKFHVTMFRKKAMYINAKFI